MVVVKSGIETVPNYTVSKEGFEWFSLIMKELNFQKIGSKQIQKDFTRLDLQRKIRGLEGVETGFIYSNKYYSVIVWTTFLEKEDKFRNLGTDVGWVIIVEKDKLKYSARYFTRSNKNFFLSLGRYAWIAKFKIDNIPHCSCEDCNRNMEITRKKGTRSYFWKCENSAKHLNPTHRSWDYGLGKKAKAFLNIRREQTQRYNKKNEELGKDPIPKATIRKTRNIGNPNNINH